MNVDGKAVAELVVKRLLVDRLHGDEERDGADEVLEEVV